MSELIQWIIVGVVVAGAAAALAAKLIRAGRKPNGCAGCANCPLSESQDNNTSECPNSLGNSESA